MATFELFKDMNITKDAKLVNDTSWLAPKDTPILSIFSNGVQAMSLLATNLVTDCILVITLCVIICMLIYVVHRSYWESVRHVRDFTEMDCDHVVPSPCIGAAHDHHIDSGVPEDYTVNTQPPAYPSGWFTLRDSNNNPVGTVVSMDALTLMMSHMTLTQTV